MFPLLFKKFIMKSRGKILEEISAWFSAGLILFVLLKLILDVLWLVGIAASAECFISQVKSFKFSKIAQLMKFWVNEPAEYSSVFCSSTIHLPALRKIDQFLQCCENDHVNWLPAKRRSAGQSETFFPRSIASSATGRIKIPGSFGGASCLIF